jgi:hypothetical protein
LEYFAKICKKSNMNDSNKLDYLASKDHAFRDYSSQSTCDVICDLIVYIGGLEVFATDEQIKFQRQIYITRRRKAETTQTSKLFWNQQDKSTVVSETKDHCKCWQLTANKCHKRLASITNLVCTFMWQNLGYWQCQKLQPVIKQHSKIEAASLWLKFVTCRYSCKITGGQFHSSIVRLQQIWMQCVMEATSLWYCYQGALS